MAKQQKEPTKFLGRMSGSFDVDPVDSDEILPGDQVVIVAVAKVKSVATEEEDKSGESKWVGSFKIRSAGVVRDEELLERIAEELGIPVPDPKLPFPPYAAVGTPTVVEDDDEDDDEPLGEIEDVLPQPAPFMPKPEPVGAAVRDEALKAFFEAQ